MKTVNAFAAALLLGTMFAGNASASSILMLDETSPTAVSSIIRLGEPDPCADNACGDEPEVISADTSGDSNGALVDSFGMPTNMPIIMRPSVDKQETPATTTASAPAAAAPSGVTQQPAPVVETPKMEPAPKVEQPVNAEQQAPQSNGQPVER